MRESDYLRIPLQIDHSRAQREVILAERPSEHGPYIVRSIPAFIYGIAFGDTIEVLDETAGTFRVLRRDGNVSIRVFIDGDLENSTVRTIIDEVLRLGGQYEIGRSASDQTKQSLLLLSIPISSGFQRIERILDAAVQRGWQWEYGNIYDEDGRQIGWWLP
jgi:hypothetical protein